MDTIAFEMRHRTSIRPNSLKADQVAFYLPHAYVEKQHELALTISFITKRRLFGIAYSGLQPEYFSTMPQGSGVYVCPMIPTDVLAPNVKFPGDIDLIILPYEKDELILHRTVAVEIKAVRAGYAKQGKSPNGFGISQAEGLLSMGFPYAALAHLITSDKSPQQAWREVGVARIVDESGLVETLPPKQIDLMPMDLMQRAIGRMEQRACNSKLGLIAAYLGSTSDELFGIDSKAVWFTEHRKALPNRLPSLTLIKNIVKLFEERPSCFLDNPRYDPI